MVVKYVKDGYLKKNTNGVVEVAAGSTHSAVLTADKRLLMFGEVEMWYVNRHGIDTFELRPTVLIVLIINVNVVEVPLMKLFGRSDLSRWILRPFT